MLTYHGSTCHRKPVYKADGTQMSLIKQAPEHLDDPCLQHVTRSLVWGSANASFNIFVDWVMWVTIVLGS
jgi:hypothetical protein